MVNYALQPRFEDKEATAFTERKGAKWITDVQATAVPRHKINTL